MLAIGLMSGTSLDGVDVALCDISGSGKETKCKLLHFMSYPIHEELKNRIKKACSLEESSVHLICELNFELGNLFADAIEALCKEANISYNTLAFIASHGQTIYHISKTQNQRIPSTLQIGDSALLAYRFHVPIISDFRVMDIAAGGEGAPLVPYSEYILYSNKEKNIALQNIGGIGNVTYLIKDGSLDDIVSFDTGPGNMMIDEAMQYFFQLQYDEGGKKAKEGQIHNDLLNELQSHPFLLRKPPKSTGREEFGKEFVHQLFHRYRKVRDVDFVATFTYFCAYSIARSYEDFLLHKYQIDELVVGGGGAHNQTLLDFLQRMLPEIKVMTQENKGFSSDAKEAVAFVILGNETLQKQASNVPNATGATEYVILGKITQNPFSYK